jgi:hypothetical protein
MKKVGDILSAFFDKETLEKAKGYGALFSSWGSLTAKCGIPQAAAHSRITGLDKSLLLVEADHPGWVQILQTKQKELLREVQEQFPGFFMAGIVLRLSRPYPRSDGETTDAVPGEAAQNEPFSEEMEQDEPIPEEPACSEPNSETVEEVTWTGDEKLTTALEKLKKSITKRPRKNFR